MFKITHFANSFIHVKSENTSLCCDPWIGKTTDNGWFSYPIKNEKEIPKDVFSSDFIYLSHLHCDHFDLKTLKHFKNKNVKFVIKKFSNGTLKKRLQKFTNKKIIELDPFKKTRLNKDLTVAIIPQIISNSSDLPDHIEYDLDTSIIIQSNKYKKVFYNNVDMPMQLKVLKKINNFVKKEFQRKIDIFCYALGAASEYPQCFMNINREKEKKKIVKNSLEEISSYLKYLKPDFFFPAGGTYTVCGKYYNLNKFIAQPSFSQIKKATSPFKTQVFNLIGGGSIKFKENEKYCAIENPLKIKEILDEGFIKDIKNIKYYYQNKHKLNLKKLDNNFEIAKKNYFRILEKKKKIDTNWIVNFNIYQKLEINDSCLIDSKKSLFIKKYILKKINLKNKKIFKLDCYMEYSLFDSLINGKFPWNTSLSGSVIMFKRAPNIYNVDMDFSLNFLRI